MENKFKNSGFIHRAALIWIMCACCVLFSGVWSQTTPLGVPTIDLYFTFEDPAAFPKHWLAPPNNMYAEGLDTLEMDHCIQLFRNFRSQYPLAFVNFHAQKFAFFSYYELNGKQMSYLCKDGWIIIWVDKEATQQGDEWIESALHFSFAQQLWILMDDSTLVKKFKALLPQGFSYTGRAYLPDEGADDNFDLESRLHAFGFATLDGTYTFERDFFGIASQLFMGREAFRKAVFAHPRLMQKTLLVIEMYRRFDSDMDVAWFLNRPIRK